MITKRIISFSCVLAILLSLSLSPVYAVEALPGDVPVNPSGGSTAITVTLGDWVGDLIQRGMDNIEYNRAWIVSKLIDDSVCPGNLENHRHNFVAQHTQVGDSFGNYYVCEYCRQTAGEVLESAYSDYTETLPATGINSSGTLFLYPVNTDLAFVTRLYNDAYWDLFRTSTRIDVSSSVEHDIRPENGSTYGVTFDYDTKCSLPYMKLTATRDFCKSDTNFSTPVLFQFSYEIPCEGTVTLSGNAGYRLRLTTDNGDLKTANYSINCSTSAVRSAGVYNAKFNGAESMWRVFNFSFDNESGKKLEMVMLQMPVATFVPSTGAYDVTSTTSTDTYNITTRPATITGDYGIMGENNELTKIDQQTIVNEGDHSVYNPVTGDTTSFDSWKFDYSTRTYTLDLGSGDSTTVTYGDEYVTINEGGTTYNVYYLLDTSNEEPEPVTPHTHNYTSSVTRQANCTLAGVETYTCSECNQSYTKAIPALGHDWVVKSQVQTEYDDDTGELTTQGYTIYECTRCGEQRRSDDGLPPASGGGDDGLINTDTNGLQQLRDTLAQFFSDFPAMFGDVTGFLQEAFPYIPDEIMQMITFAVGVSVLMGIFKFFWR